MYEITIKETRQVRKTVGKKWAKLGTVEKEREGRFYACDDKEPKTYMGDEMGYTPETETVEEETIVRLTQNVEKLDMAKVVKAINDL